MNANTKGGWEIKVVLRGHWISLGTLISPLMLWFGSALEYFPVKYVPNETSDLLRELHQFSSRLFQLQLEFLLKNWLICGPLVPFPSSSCVWGLLQPLNLYLLLAQEICTGRSTTQSCCHCEMLRPPVCLMGVTMKYRKIKSVLKYHFSAMNFVHKAER